MAMTLITTNTSSGASDSSFTSGIDSTYKLYIFKYYGVNPGTDNVGFRFNGSSDSGSNYNVTKTTAAFRSKHTEDDSAVQLNYEGGLDLAQSTGAQLIMNDVGSGADEHAAGEFFLFNPSNTTYVKHFYLRSMSNISSDYAQDLFIAGYFNTTSAIDAIQFTVSSGVFDAVIKMYGVG